MKISFDLDGTAWSHMAFFRALSTAMQATGHEVGVLTGHRAEAEAEDREKLRAAGFPELNFYLGRTEPYMPLNGAVFKSDMIRAHDIAIHFDDLDYSNPETERLFRADSAVWRRLFVVPDKGHGVVSE